MAGLTYISEEDLELLKEIKDLMNNTHQYDTELYEELSDVIHDLDNEDKMTEEDLEDLLTRSKYQLSNCHCDDHETFEVLVERLSK